MMKIQRTYIALVALILAFTSCDKLIYDQETDGEPTVYLSVSYAAGPQGESAVARAQGVNESINQDATDYEDRVHDLALLIFDTATGEKIGQYFTSALTSGAASYAFTAKLTPGNRDFYFVANMQGTQAALEAITSRTAMDVYMNTFRELDTDHYLGAAQSHGFPMSRVYLSQNITEGGSIYQPKPFKPVVGGNEENLVKLIRVVAKLEVQFAGTNLGVKDVYYKNAFRKFSLTAPAPPAYTITDYYTAGDGNKLKKSGDSYLYYMPEALMNAPAWGSAPHQPVNYFVIETTNGTQYEIPIISYEGSLPGAGYLAFARGEQTNKPDYNIYRNRHYKYVVNNLQTIEVIYEIDPWKQVVKSLYMGYGYNVEVDENGNVSIANTVLACDPHSVELKTINGFTFNDDATSKTFDSLSESASASYTLNSVPAAGQAYLEVHYNGALVKTFTK